MDKSDVLRIADEMELQTAGTYQALAALVKRWAARLRAAGRGPAHFDVEQFYADDAPEPQAPVEVQGSGGRDDGPPAWFVRDLNKMRGAGNALAIAATRIIDTYDGVHRLSLAVAAWYSALGNAGGRGAPESQEETQQTKDMDQNGYNGIEGFVCDLGATVRECIDCGCLVPGGPTRCKRCAADIHDAPEPQANPECESKVIAQDAAPAEVRINLPTDGKGRYLFEESTAWPFGGEPRSGTLGGVWFSAKVHGAPEPQAEQSPSAWAEVAENLKAQNNELIAEVAQLKDLLRAAARRVPDNPFCAEKCNGATAADHARCRAERFDVGIECSRGLLRHTHGAPESQERASTITPEEVKAAMNRPPDPTLRENLDRVFRSSPPSVLLRSGSAPESQADPDKCEWLDACNSCGGDFCLKSTNGSLGEYGSTYCKACTDAGRNPKAKGTPPDDPDCNECDKQASLDCDECCDWPGTWANMHATLWAYSDALERKQEEVDEWRETSDYWHRAGIDRCADWNKSRHERDEARADAEEWKRAAFEAGEQVKELKTQLANLMHVSSARRDAKEHAERRAKNAEYRKLNLEERIAQLTEANAKLIRERDGAFADLAVARGKVEELRQAAEATLVEHIETAGRLRRERNAARAEVKRLNHGIELMRDAVTRRGSDINPQWLLTQTTRLLERCGE